MGFFSKWFGHDKSNLDAVHATVRSEVNITECIAAHMKWKGRLQSYMDGTSEEKLDPMIICRDDQCVLGKWIHGPALNYFHEDEGFHRLRSDHANFHFVAGSVVKKVQENDKAGADALFRKEYAYASRDVIYDLAELNKHLNDK
jgi:hypothetical protein